MDTGLLLYFYVRSFVAICCLDGLHIFVCREMILLEGSCFLWVAVLVHDAHGFLAAVRGMGVSRKSQDVLIHLIESANEKWKISLLIL